MASFKTAQGFRHVLSAHSIIICFCDKRKLDLYLMYPWLLRADNKIVFSKEQIAEKWDTPLISLVGISSHTLMNKILHGQAATFSLITLIRQFPTNSLKNIEGFWIE